MRDGRKGKLLRPSRTGHGGVLWQGSFTVPVAVSHGSQAIAMKLNPSLRQFIALGLLSLLMALLLITQAAAQRPSEAQAAAIKSNCRSDYMSYCSSVPTGGMASLQCLQQHTAELSPPCQSAVQATEAGSAPPAEAAARPAPLPEMTLREEARLLRDACGRDFETYCRGVRLGRGRAVACLAQNEQQLSPACKGALAEARADR